MPVIKLKHIVSFSSEDPNHPADNLLKSETYRKWQCVDPAEKQASVIIELEKASKINSLDIGNNGSAFVEVLVGRASLNDYQVLLVASSFMSPAESKSGTNNNRVRIFGPEKLSKTVAEQKWDRIKLVCTQPYSKTSCYGLSFVNFHTLESDEKIETQEKTKTKLGAFFLKDETEDTITSGSLFAKRKEKTERTSSQVKSTAAELREASKHAVVVATTSSAKFDVKPENSDKKKAAEIVREFGLIQLFFIYPLKRNVNTITSPKHADIPKLSSKEKVEPPVKKAKLAKTQESQKREIATNQILKDVIFVLSGFKNPERSNFRDKAMSMGARYRGDWDKACTHLICAFINTPKYSQVKATGKGKIVSQKWVHECLNKRKRLPEKRYKLHGDDDSDDDSTEEEVEIPEQEDHSDKARPTISNCTEQKASSSHRQDEMTTQKKEESILPNADSNAPPVASIENKVNNMDNPEESLDSEDKTQIIDDEILDSDYDTEDEIARISKDETDPYNCSTECESDDDDDDSKKLNRKLKDKTTPPKSPKLDLLNLPDFFSKMTFFLHGEFDSDERRILVRYITAYDGELEEYMSENVKYVITNEDWDDNFDEALVDNSSLTFVRPKWIFSCHDKRSFVPFQPYIVVPHYA
ncbi:DNA repair protein XRCC1-like [Dendronephthya gigantea]|uniref:DNA repair protein XRCC1-like n=1 Tax=Dendronephthya gigantea TaxID=151771 RepID=UPI00106DA5B0|nr:DNA repair protein XRCC1-like [Dendronephthya gigantea]